ncbi:DUF348 domain-containing protein [Candidatus Saccharibacteria bacterium]|nr:DUF348 domain-containing protein [Candidatus Saccharibacteria bacterium]
MQRKQPKPKPYSLQRALVAFGLIILFVLTSIAWSHDQFTANNTALADGQNLVSVYYDGQNKTVATSATTVGEALHKMGINLEKGDVVEPGIDTPVTLGVTNINIYRSLSYLVEDGDKRLSTTSGYHSPRKIVEQSGITLYPEDTIETERVDSFVVDQSVGQRIIINRATPVTVVLAGKTFQLRTHKKTVGELFTEKGLEIKPQDIVRTSLDAPLQSGMTVVVNRLAQRIVTQEVAIDPAVVQSTDTTKPIGFSEISDPGSPGKKTLSFLLTEQDGIEQARQLLEEKVTLEAKPKRIVVGPTEKTGASSDGWVKLRFCESGGNYANKRNPAYRGAYQFDYSTWNNYGGFRDPADAPADVQDAKALETYTRRGASPWPLCGRFLR